MKLWDIAHSRTGDKGNISNISLIAYDSKDYELLKDRVTAEKVKEHFRGIVKGDVVRYELPNIYALNFVMQAALGGGVTRSLSLDMRIMDAMLAIPIIILALFLGSALGKGLGNIILCIGISMIPRYARVTRGSVLQVKKLDYVTASKISGASKIKIARVHILKNCLSSNLVMMTMNLGDAILTEASLSYLGMGINPPTPSWGGMVSNGYDWLSMNPTVAIAPGIFIILTVWAFNVCGDALRDALDPKLKGVL